MPVDPEVAVIGFAGAPFTLASYLIQGGASKDHLAARRFMMSEPEGWNALMKKLGTAVSRHLVVQVTAEADIVQLFDSWVGTLTPADYREYVLPHMADMFEVVRRAGAPTIHFGTGTATLLELMKEAGGDVMGIGWHVPLDQARRRLGGMPLQGNLDPVVLLAPEPEVIRRVNRVLKAAGDGPHIFNLGHGILPSTPPENAIRVLRHVHKATAR